MDYSSFTSTPNLILRPRLAVSHASISGTEAMIAPMPSHEVFIPSDNDQAATMQQLTRLRRQASAGTVASAPAPAGVEVTVEKWGQGRNSSLEGILLGQGYTRKEIYDRSSGMSLVDRVAASNNLKNPNLIHPGQVLTIPSRESAPAQGSALQVGPTPPTPSTTPAATQPASSAIGSFFGGIGKAAKGTVTDTIDMLAHPIETAKGLGHAIAHPFDTISAVGSSVKNAFASNAAEASGRAAFEVAAALTPLGILKAARLAKAGQMVRRASSAVQVLDASSDLGRGARLVGSSRTAAAAANASGTLESTALAVRSGNGTAQVTALARRSSGAAEVIDVIDVPASTASRSQALARRSSRAAEVFDVIDVPASTASRSQALAVVEARASESASLNQITALARRGEQGVARAGSSLEPRTIHINIPGRGAEAVQSPSLLAGVAAAGVGMYLASDD